MKPRDPAVEYWSGQINMLKQQYDIAKQQTSIYRNQMNSSFDDLQSLQEKYRELKAQADYEFQQASYCWDCNDRISAKTHSENGKSFNQQKNYLRTSLDSAHAKFNSARTIFQSAKRDQEEIKKQLDNAYNTLNARIEELKTQNIREALKWHEKSCRRCGTSIRYNEDWAHIPTLCKECKEKLKSEKEEEAKKWKEQPCKDCGKMIRYKIDWNHIPNYCEDCKEKFKQKQSKKQKPAKQQESIGSI